jgi:hypothetical protein
MNELFFGGFAPWFTVPALVGTGFFLVRLLLMLGFGHGLDIHADDGSGFDLEHGDTEGAFKVLSVQAISAFLMGFGWGGLGAYRGWGLPALVSGPVGFVFGATMMWILAKMFRWISGMQASGTVDISGALLQEGTVYTAIPARGNGKGMVRVVIDDRLRYYNAVSDGAAIDSQSRVRVTEVNSDTNSVVVTKVEGSE